MKRFAAHLPRLFLGLLFTAFGAMVLFHLVPDQPPYEGIAGTYVQALSGTYLMTLVKLTELVAGLLLLSNRLVAFALVLLAPIVVNIFAFHALVVQSGVALPVVIVAVLGFAAWQQREAYRPLFASKKTSTQPRGALQPA